MGNDCLPYCECKGGAPVFVHRKWERIEIFISDVVYNGKYRAFAVIDGLRYGPTGYCKTIRGANVAGLRLAEKIIARKG